MKSTYLLNRLLYQHLEGSEHHSSSALLCISRAVLVHRNIAFTVMSATSLKDTSVNCPHFEEAEIQYLGPAVAKDHITVTV